MESGNISIPRERCMKCQNESDILMTFHGVFDDIEFCSHKFCQGCFRKENTSSCLGFNLTYTHKCPCCYTSFYETMQTINEGAQIGEAINIITHMIPHLSLLIDIQIADCDVVRINEINMAVLEKLEAALLINPSNFYTLYLLSHCCNNGQIIMIRYKNKYTLEFYRVKLFNCSIKLLDHAALSQGRTELKIECCVCVATVFHEYRNHSAALKYAKLAYEHCLRSSDHTNLSSYKDEYLDYRAAFAALPPLRFTVGDEVEFLYELETESEWQLGKVVELYYREKDFDIAFTAPYRIQHLVDSDAADEPPVYGWVKADNDRYIRKVGVRSIEETRYQLRLNVKVAELAQVYCCREFMQDIYRTLAQDLEFVEMLQSVWKVELSVHMLLLYRVCFMIRHPLVRINSGYHVPSHAEVIAGIKAYFNPTRLNCDVPGTPTAAGESIDSQWINRILQGIPMDPPDVINELDVQGMLLHSIRNYNSFFSPSQSPGVQYKVSELSIPSEISTAISKASVVWDLITLQSEARYDTKVGYFLVAWVGVQFCLDNPNTGSACECPFVYFLIKKCLDLGWGVPKLALTLYDRMNMQLSREFIRCANPTCTLNRLDRSTGQVKFKKCSQCQAVIYCSRECQVAHYPEHKRLCVSISTSKNDC